MRRRWKVSKRESSGFEEAYFTHRLWMFYKARETMKNEITLKKKSDPGKFTIPCTVKGIEFPHALCDT